MFINNEPYYLQEWIQRKGDLFMHPSLPDATFVGLASQPSSVTPVGLAGNGGEGGRPERSEGDVRIPWHYLRLGN